MSLYDSYKESYGAISRFNHWLGAAAILVLLGIGLYFHEMPRG
jgi:cytochrome b561